MRLNKLFTFLLGVSVLPSIVSLTEWYRTGTSTHSPTSMVSCSKCKSEAVDTYALAKCDQCAILLCIECSKLTASEHRGITVKKRSAGITYHCIECLSKSNTTGYCGLSKAELQTMVSRTIQAEMADLKTFLNKHTEVNAGGMKDVAEELRGQSKIITGMAAALQEIKPIEKQSNELEILRKEFKSLGKKYEAQQAELKLLREDIKSVRALREDYESNKLELELLKKDLAKFQKILAQNNSKPNSNSKNDSNPALFHLESITPTAREKSFQTKSGRVVGQRKDCDKLVASTPQTSVLISKVSLDIDSKDLKDYLHNTFGPEERFAIEPLVVKSGEYKSFKVMTRRVLEDALLNPQNWPENIEVKKFSFFRPQQSWSKSSATNGNDYRNQQKQKNSNFIQNRKRTQH